MDRPVALLCRGSLKGVRVGKKGEGEKAGAMRVGYPIARGGGGARNGGGKRRDIVKEEAERMASRGMLCPYGKWDGTWTTGREGELGGRAR